MRTKEEQELVTIFTENVKAVRKYRGLTQRAAAALAGMHHIRWCEMEKSTKTPYTETLVKAAVALSVEPYELLDPKTKERFHAD
jgi:transcriptional regulator with XRE-family HTH domain